MIKSGWISKKRVLTFLLKLVCTYSSQLYNINLFFPYQLTVKKQVTICDSALEACKEAEAIVIATEWKEFRNIDWETVHATMKKPAFIFDGRLLLDAEKLRKIGFNVCITYFGHKPILIPISVQVTTIGRPSPGIETST